MWKSHYKILLAAIAVILVLSLINYFVFYDVSLYGLKLAFNLLIDAIQYTLVFLAMHASFTIYQHQRPSINIRRIKSLVIAFITIFVSGFMSAILLMELEFLILDYRDINFYQKDAFIILVYTLLLSALYITIRIIFTPINTYSSHLISKIGSRNVRIDTKEITAGLIIGGQSMILFQQKLFPVSLSLDQVETRLGDNFLRLNRQLLARRDVIQSYRSISGGKVKIQFSTPKIPESYAIVSRLKASRFRQWVKATGSSTQ